jgi:hypothetical protein
LETRLAEFKVRNVGLAARCEVCHQDDLFNAETGECARCSGVLAALEVSPPATIPATAAEASSPPHTFGWSLASAALILSTIMGIPGTVALVVVLYLLLTSTGNNRSTGDALLFLTFMGCFLGFIGAGYYQLYWYWKIWRFETESSHRRRVWFWSTVYNALLLLGIGFFLNSLLLTGNPLALLWFGMVGVMTVISGFALLEEYKPR